jgi:hypothetical protein
LSASLPSTFTQHSPIPPPRRPQSAWTSLNGVLLGEVAELNQLGGVQPRDGIAAHQAGGAVLLTGNKGRLATQRGVATATVAKAAVS